MNSPTPPDLKPAIGKLLKQGSKILYTAGLFLIFIGILAILFPVVSTLAFNYFVGLMLLLAGLSQLVGSHSLKGTQAHFSAVLLALLSLLASVFMIFNPLASVMVLTLILAVLFIIEGTFHIVFAMEIYPNRGFGLMLISGLISIFLGLFIVSGLSELSLIILGILLGVNFLSTGIAFVFFHRQIEKAFEENS